MARHLLNTRLLGLVLIIGLLAHGAAYAGALEDTLSAIKRDDARTTVGLLARGGDIDTVDAQGFSLLALAAREGSLSVSRLLLGAGAKIEAVNMVGENALMLAALHGHLEIVRALLVAGAATEKVGWKPLIYAAVKGDIRIARL